MASATHHTSFASLSPGYLAGLRAAPTALGALLDIWTRHEAALHVAQEAAVAAQQESAYASADAASFEIDRLHTRMFAIEREIMDIEAETPSEVLAKLRIALRSARAAAAPDVLEDDWRLPSKQRRG